METGTIGSRIREQRERLGYSQAEIAEKAGVTARSQRNYETGTRVPDAGYLATIAPLGIDINYVLNGRRAYQEHNGPQESTFVLAFEMAFGISSADLGKIVEKTLVDDEVTGFSPSVFFDGMMRESSVFRLMADQYATLNIGLLTSTLEGIEAVTTKENLNITPAKKASAAAILYRTFKASGKIDYVMIKETIYLAAS